MNFFFKNKYNLIIANLILASVFAFFYLVIKFQILFPEQQRFYYKYYFLIFFNILFLILIYFQKKKIKKFFSIFYLFSLFMFYSFEIFLTFFDIEKYVEDKKINKKLLQSKGNYDIRDPFQVHLDLKKNGKESILTARISDLLKDDYEIDIGKGEKIFPLSGVSNILTIFCNESGEYIINLADRYGLNNKDEIWDKDKIDIIVIGSSFAAGYCVDRDKFEGYSGQIYSVTNKIVLNLGYPSSGALIVVARLKEFFPEDKNVKKVIWFIEGREVNHTIEREFSKTILKKYMQSQIGVNYKQNLSSYYTIINKNLQERFKKTVQEYELQNIPSVKIVRSKKFLDVIKLKRSRDLLLASRFNYKVKKLINAEIMLDELLKDLMFYLENKNVELILACGPSYQKFASGIKGKQTDDCKTITQIANKNRIKTFDIYEELFKHSQDPLSYFPYGLEGHYSAETYKKIIQLMNRRGYFN